MTPRKRATSTEPELARLPEPASLGAGAQPIGLTPTEERREREYEEILDEIGTDGRIRVWHIIDGKSAFAGDMDAASFNLAALLETFGGGEKSLVFYQGRTKVDTIRVSLDPSVPVTSPRARTAGITSGAAATPVAGGLTEFAAMLTTMVSMQMQGMQATQQMMTGMVTAMTSLMTARPEKDPMELAMQMAALMKGNGGDVSQALSMLEKGMNIGKSLTGGNDEDGTIAVIKEGIGVIGKVVEASAQARHSAANGPVRVVQSASVAPRDASHVHGGHGNAGAGSVGDEGGTREPEGTGTTFDTGAGGGSMGDGVVARLWVRSAQEHAASLTMAARFLSADTAAIELIRRMDDDTLEDFMQDVDDETAPGFEARVRATFPNFQPTTEWFAQFLATIRANVDVGGEDGEDGAPGNETGNGVAPATDGL